MTDTDRYNDIIALSRPKSKKHPPMSALDRAGQFSPFASIKGYGDEIEEEARFVEGRVELDEERISAINEVLLILKAQEREHPRVRITFFKPDERKEGGAFLTLTAGLKKIDEQRSTLHLEDEDIPFDNIMEIEIVSGQ